MTLDSSFGGLLIAVLLIVLVGPPILLALVSGLLYGIRQASYPVDSQRVAWRLGLVMQAGVWFIAIVGRNQLGVFGGSFAGYCVGLACTLLPGVLIAWWKGLGPAWLRFYKAVLTAGIVSLLAPTLVLSGNMPLGTLGFLLAAIGVFFTYIAVNRLLDKAYARGQHTLVTLVFGDLLVASFIGIMLLYHSVPAVAHIGYVRARQLARSSLVYYVPKGYNGPLKLTAVGSNFAQTHATPELTADYDINHYDGLRVTITKKNASFNPPSSCGAEVTRAGVCKWVFTTPKGQAVYGFRNADRLHYFGADAQPNLIAKVQPEMFYTVIGGELLTMEDPHITNYDDNSSEITPAELGEFVDSLQPYRGADLGSLLSKHYIEF